MNARPLLILALTTLLACGDKDDDTGAAGSTATCEDMCLDEGFTAGTLAEYDHEANCTCEGSGTVSAAACTDMCTGAGWSAGDTYSSDGGDVDSCSCN
jgi:hypothetical protein